MNRDLSLKLSQVRQLLTDVSTSVGEHCSLWCARVLVGWLILVLMCPPALAQGGLQQGTKLDPLQQDFLIRSQKNQGFTRADEYYAESVAGEILVAINLLGAVRRSGIYHLPKQTDIIQLISLSGGITEQSDLSRVTIKRRNRERERVILVNLEDVFQRPGTLSPVLEAGDVVMIPVKEPPVSTSTLTLIGLVSSIISIIVSGLVLSKSLSRN